MCLSHGQVMSKFYTSGLNFYLSRTIGQGFWCTLGTSVPHFIRTVAEVDKSEGGLESTETEVIIQESGVRIEI